MKSKRASKPRRGALHVFTDAQVRALGEGNHSDGGNLILAVKGASRRWYFRYTRDGRTLYVEMGPAADVPLKDARTRASECRRQLAAGIDPKAEAQRRSDADRAVKQTIEISRQRQAATLETVATEYHAAHLSEWTAKHGAQWLSSLKLNVFPALGGKPIGEITPGDLLDVLLPMRAAIPETATRVRERLDTIFSDSVLRGLCDHNPAAAIRKSMRQRKRVRKHHAAMGARAVPAFIKRLRSEPRIALPVSLALEFLIITASRTAEVIGARWDEIDMSAATWTIPAPRMKARKPHVVYLSARCIQILKEAKTLDSDYCFPSPQRMARPLSNMAFLNALKRLDLWGPDVPEADRITAHGFRSSFSTWANDRHYPADVIEAALAHVEGNAVRGAYNRAEYIAQRKKLAKAWSDHCCRR